MTFARRAVLSFSLALPAATSLAQMPIGGEFQVNTSTSGNQWDPHVAGDPQGRFVVAWRRDGTTAPQNILARRFDAAGVPQGSEFVVNTYNVPQTVGRPQVAFEANGGFIVVFARKDWQPTMPHTILARRYDAAGAPRGPEFLVATVEGGPQVSAGSGGGFVVTWGEINGSMFAKLYDAAGGPVATTLIGSGFQASPAVTMTPNGGFVVAWSVNATPYTVWARLFDAAAVPRGPAFPVASGGNFKHQVGVASDAAGNFTVSWHDSGPSGGDDVGPMARRYDANGLPLTPALAVSTFAPGYQGGPAVAMAANGHAVVTWTSHPINTNCLPPPFPCPQPPPQDGSGSGVFGRFLDASGTPVGGEFAVNEYTFAEQDDPTVALDAAGRFIVAWRDPLRDGLFARRFYAGLLPSALDVDRVATPGSNGNRVFEAGETVAIEPSWRNTTSVPLTFSGAAASLGGPPGPTYTTVDAAASYGTIPAGASASCRDQADCYSASITGARPAPHWDAVLSEDFLPTGSGISNSWAVHVGESFSDVPTASPFYRFIETLFHLDVTSGCASGLYCPAASVPREQMPVFVLRSYLPALVPPPCVAGSEEFADVPAASPYCRWIEELARRGVVAGCGGGNYCPADPVRRETMAVYLGATLALNPPPCGIPVFGDVPASSPYCRWIEELARRGVVAGCGGGDYCPAQAVSREQMAVFLSVTFGLVLYGP